MPAMHDVAGLGALLAMADDDSDGGDVEAASTGGGHAGDPAAVVTTTEGGSAADMDFLCALADESDDDVVRGTPSRLPRTAFDDYNHQRTPHQGDGLTPSAAQLTDAAGRSQDHDLRSAVRPTPRRNPPDESGELLLTPLTDSA